MSHGASTHAACRLATQHRCLEVHVSCFVHTFPHNNVQTNLADLKVFSLFIASDRLHRMETSIDLLL